MRFQITIEVWKKGKWFIAKASELDFVSQGKTFEEAKRNLLEVIKIQFREMREMGTLEEYLSEYDEIDVEIIKNNMRTVGMTREQYFDLLKKV